MPSASRKAQHDRPHHPSQRGEGRKQGTGFARFRSRRSEFSESSDDATIAPDYNSPKHGERLHREFPLRSHEDGCGGWLVDVDQRPPRSVALALTLAILIAKGGREPT